MAKALELPLLEARALCLEAQGLGRERSPFGSGKAGALRAIEHLGYVQIDTISAVERAHHHVLWSRVGDYSPALLHELVTRDRAVFEYWSHAASYLPMRDYRYCLPRMQRYAAGHRHWFKQNRKLMDAVLERIRAEGPLQARHFEAPPGRKSKGWFDWKPAKRALENLYITGELMVRERRGFEKVYDLPERVIPAGTDTRAPTPDEMARYLIRQALRAHGLAQEPEMRYLRQGVRTDIGRALGEMEETGEIVRVRVRDDGGGTGAEKGAAGTFFAFAKSLTPGTLKASRGPRSSARAGLRILSPFDNLVIQRKRVRRLFGFDYMIECYVPAPKRKYGYFCLPLLWEDRLVGRIDAKADRASGTLKVLQLHPEPWLPSDRKRKRAFAEALEESLREFAAFNGCERLEGSDG